MTGWLRHFGFALPLSIAMGLETEGPRDGNPSRGLCHLCRRESPVTYALGPSWRVCREDIEDTLASRKVRMAQAHRRSPWYPQELVAVRDEDRVPLDPWWDQQCE